MLQALSGLTWLELHDNELSTLPRSISSLAGLQLPRPVACVSAKCKHTHVDVDQCRRKYTVCMRMFVDVYVCLCVCVFTVPLGGHFLFLVICGVRAFKMQTHTSPCGSDADGNIPCVCVCLFMCMFVYVYVC
jgi:hypothetical protein